MNIRFFKILVGIGQFAFIKAGSEVFIILTDACISRHNGTLTVSNQSGKPFLTAKMKSGTMEYYDLWNEISEAQWESELSAFCREA